MQNAIQILSESWSQHESILKRLTYLILGSFIEVLSLYMYTPILSQQDRISQDVSEKYTISIFRAEFSPKLWYLPRSPSVNFFDDGAVLLRSILWTLWIVSMFCNHNVSRDGYSLETLCLQNRETMDTVQRIDRGT
jgi:hypothetical protein